MTRYDLASDSIACRKLGDEYVMVHLERDQVHYTNPTASVLVQALSRGGATRQDLIEALLERFEVDASRAASDVDAFLKTAEEHGLIRVEMEPECDR